MKEPLSVSKYIAILNQGIQRYKGRIIGEVSSLDFGPTGHLYFSLKDEEDQSIIKCIIWRHHYKLYGVELKEGAKIIASGSPNIHKQYGFSFIAEAIEYAGEGELKKEYEKLKKKLSEEGVFAQERKRPIPLYLQKIGVVTSLKGAVIADFCNNLGKFGFKVEMIDSRVEGQTAVRDLLSAIRTFKKREIEVLIIIRGGGSLESMIAFNNEKLVREVVNFPVPVIVGIGHDKDIPLVSLAADLAVSTPTASANLINRPWEKVVLFIEKKERKVISIYQEKINNLNTFMFQSIRSLDNYCDFIFKNHKEIENRLKLSFRNFQNILLNVKIKIEDFTVKSFSGLKLLISQGKKQIDYAGKVINLNDPKRQLKLGYSIARIDGKIIKKTEDVNLGKEINLKISNGNIISEIKNIKKND